MRSNNPYRPNQESNEGIEFFNQGPIGKSCSPRERKYTQAEKIMGQAPDDFSKKTI
jgi:hypothetical protein